MVGGLEDLERCLREEETRETQEKEEKSKWDIKKKFEAEADGKEGDAGKLKAKLPKLVITCNKVANAIKQCSIHF